jgi:hypothetical protein
MGDEGTNRKEQRHTDEAETPFPLTDVDRWVLSQTDEEFHLQTWQDLKKIIGKDYRTFVLAFKADQYCL